MGSNPSAAPACPVSSLQQSWKGKSVLIGRLRETLRGLAETQQVGLSWALGLGCGAWSLLFRSLQPVGPQVGTYRRVGFKIATEVTSGS